MYFCFQPHLYKYKVIGGCHEAEAVKQLNKEDPTNKLWQTREVHVYGNDLSDEAMTFLAVLHNEVQAMHSSVTTQEKVS